MPTTTLTRILDLYALLNLNPHDGAAAILRERIARLCLAGRRA